MGPALSILIPARNAAATLNEALASIASQSFRDWEALVVDDGSTDETAVLIASWTRRDPRFRLLRQDTPSGIVTALNRAAAEAQAPVLARMDADDVSLPTRFERQLARLALGDAQAVGCQVRYFPPDQVAGGALRYEAWLNSVLTPVEHDRDVFVECPLAHPTLMLHAHALRFVGGYQSRGWPEDYDLLLRLWEAGYGMAKVPEVLLHWRESPSRTSRTQPECSLEALVRCRAHYLRRTHLQEVPAVIFGAGRVGKAMARALLAEGVPLTAFVEVDARKVGRTVHGAPVLHWREGFQLRGQAFGVAALGQPGARNELRQALQAAGWVEGVHFRCVA
jgi:cellulose synthase/poly-beta-1,6-N-acetylglucosamine synthase-like glycosyltransferase